jgi:hypothetical protein
MNSSQRREPDSHYFSRRAAQEMAAADAAAGRPGEGPHRRLAERYALLAASIAEVQEQLG